MSDSKQKNKKMKRGKSRSLNITNRVEIKKFTQKTVINSHGSTIIVEKGGNKTTTIKINGTGKFNLIVNGQETKVDCH
jgi:hypothetical protein